MTKKKEAGARPRRYDEAFKQEAVRLWKSSGRSAEPTGSPVSKEDLVAENERLRRELSRITEQRDILKKPRASSPNRRRAVCPD